jgi:type II secretory pathway pseudopilin PulG
MEDQMPRHVVVVLVLSLFVSAGSRAEVSPSKRALIGELIRVSNGYVLGAGFLTQILTLGHEKPVSEAEIAEVRERLIGDPAIEKMIRENFLDVYDRSFSEGQLRDLIAFFKTPLGRKYAELQLDLGTQGRSSLAGAAAIELQKNLQDSKAKRTMSDMSSLATATESYGIDNDTGNGSKHPDAKDIRALGKLLTPTYILRPPEQDAWGNDFVYVVSTDKRHFRIISAGPNGKIDSLSPRVGSKPASGGDDIINEDGKFVQQPFANSPN